MNSILNLTRRFASKTFTKVTDKIKFSTDSNKRIIEVDSSRAFDKMLDAYIYGIIGSTFHGSGDWTIDTLKYGRKHYRSCDKSQIQVNALFSSLGGAIFGFARGLVLPIYLPAVIYEEFTTKS